MYAIGCTVDILMLPLTTHTYIYVYINGTYGISLAEELFL